MDAENCRSGFITVLQLTRSSLPPAITYFSDTRFSQAMLGKPPSRPNGAETRRMSMDLLNSSIVTGKTFLAMGEPRTRQSREPGPGNLCFSVTGSES